MLGDIQFREDDNALVMGFLEVIDFKGVGPGHIFHFNAVLVKKIAVLGDKALPYRPKGFHFVNVNSSCEKIMSVAKNMMSDKIKKRVSGKLLQIVYAHIVYIILNNSCNLSTLTVSRAFEFRIPLQTYTARVSTGRIWWQQWHT